MNDTYLYCAACRLNPHNSSELVYGYKAFNTGTMLHHLQKHIEKGHQVSKKLTSSLLKDDDNNFPEGGASGGYYTKAAQGKDE